MAWRMAQLLADDLVDEAAVVAIKRQFKHMTRNGKFRFDQEPVLTLDLVFEEIRSRVATNTPVSAGAADYDIGPDKKFKWQDYATWKKQSWERRLKAAEGTFGPASGSGAMKPSSPSGNKKTGIPVAGAMAKRGRR